MKHFGAVAVSLVLFLFGLGERGTAQTWDYLDVPPGLETLNLAVEGDTTASGNPKSLNRVYRLQRGGVYLLNGRLISIKGSPLRIFAADGAGAKPLIIMAVDQTGANDDFAYLYGDGHFKNLYISGIDDIGKQDRYTMALYDTAARVIFDGVHVDHSRQSHIRTYGPNQKVYFLNCEFRNSIDLAAPSNGRFFDGRGVAQDSLVFINCTLYLNSQRMFRTDGAITKNIIFDHNTFYQNAYGGTTSSGWKISGGIETGKGVNVKITNNIFQDINVEALRHAKTLSPIDRMPVIHVDSLGTGAGIPLETERKWTVKNNAYAWSPGFVSFYAARTDTVKPPVFISKFGDSLFFKAKPNFVQSNNFEELIQFADAPKPDSLLKYVAHRFNTNFSNVGNPNPRADRNGIGSLTTNPGSFGLETDPFNFDYPTTQKAYTAGDGGFPLGDLNWFPAKKAQWETWVTGVEDKDLIITDYRLEQNYPNPFNPTTRIEYSLPKATRLSIRIYNALGQEVASLLNDQDHAPGTYSVVWNGSDAHNTPVASGVYYYQLTTPDRQIVNKMVLVK